MTNNKVKLVGLSLRYAVCAAIVTSLIATNANSQAMNPDTEVTEVMMDAHYSGAGFMFTLLGWDPSQPTLSFNTSVDVLNKSYSVHTQSGQTYFGQQLSMSINGAWNNVSQRWESTMEANLAGFEFGADGFGSYVNTGPSEWAGEFLWNGHTNEDIVWHTHKWDTIRTIAGVEHSYHNVFELGKFSSTTTTRLYDLKQPGGAWQVFGMADKPDGVGVASIDISGDSWIGISSITYAAVPEPTTLAAFGIGALGILRARRRK